jgi:Uma2 family endonuclease
MLFHDEASVIAAIMENPSAPALVARLQSALDEERQRRQQFYAEIDDSMKAEFINGEVIIHSPVKKQHGDISGFLFKLIDTYVRINNIGHIGHEKILIALSRNDYEPDLVYFNSEKSKGFKPQQWKFPVPDFVVEILSDSTQGKDRGIKFEDYAAHGISEYWIIDPDDESIEQYVLNGKEYKLNLKAHKGNIDSVAITGFSIEIRALFDAEVNLAELKKIIG